ncbi:MAG: BrnT family toxin [Candidatus Binatia bacterium]
MALDFEWDPAKAEANLKEHGVSFDEATTIFRDTRSITISDPDHSDSEIALSISACLIACICSWCRTQSGKIRFES